jgi:hypothetical protein
MTRAFLHLLLALAAIALCAVSKPVLAATPHVNDTLGFAVDVPDGWVLAPDQMEADLLIQQGDVEPRFAQKCYVTVDKIAINATQQQMDDRYAAEWQSAAYWDRYISKISPDALLLSHGLLQGRHVRGGRGEFYYDNSKGVVVQAMTFRYFTPQRAFSMQCMGPAIDFEAARAEMEQFLASLRPL